VTRPAGELVGHGEVRVASGNARHGREPVICTYTITRADDVRAVLNAAAGGNVVCFSGGDLVGAAPIRVVSDGGALHEVQWQRASAHR
jgi:hypothetical protein